MRLKRATAIVLIGLVLVLLLASFHCLHNNFQPAYTQLYTNEEVIQKIDFGLQSTPGFNISIPSGKYIREINITLTDITAPNNIIRPEEGSGIKDIRLHSEEDNKFMAMCFNLSEDAYLETNSAYLDNVILYLEHETGSQEINVTIMGADGEGKPSTYINSTSYIVPNDANWVNITMNHTFLDKDRTINGVFFVCVAHNRTTQSDKIYWYAAPDTSPENDYGPAYEGNIGNWALVNSTLNASETVDFALRVNISTSASPPYNIPDPRNISLKINRNPPLLGYSYKGNGSYRLYNIIPQNDLAYFNVYSPLYNMSYADNPPITFNVEANYTLADISGIFNLLPFALGLMGSSQGGGFLLFFGGGGLVVAVVGLVGGLAVVHTRRRKHLLNALRKLSRIMAVNVSGINVFDFPFSEDESGADATLIAASISAVSSIEAEADTRESKITGRRDWFTTDKRIFFNLGASEVIVNETERSIFEGWWIGGVFDEPLSDEERNQVRKVIKSLGDEAVRLARQDSKVYDNFVQWNGQTRVFKEFYLQVLNNGLTAAGLSIDKVMELRLQGIQKLKMIFKLTEMGSSLLIERMLSSLENFESVVICFNISRDMWVKDVRNLLNKKQVKKLKKSAQDKETSLYSSIKGESVTRIQAAFVYLMLLMKKLASRNLKLDVIFFGLPPEYKDRVARGISAESLEERKITLENINPSDPKTWNLFTQTLFDIASRGEANSSVKMEFESILKEIELCLKDREEVEATATIIFTAGGLNTPQIIKMVKSQKLTNTYTFLTGAPQEEKIQIPAQFIPIPAVSEENIKPLMENIN